VAQIIELPEYLYNNYNPPNYWKKLCPCDSHLKTKTIVIYVIGGIVGTALLTGIGILLYRWYKKRKESEFLEVFDNDDNQDIPSTDIN